MLFVSKLIAWNTLVLGGGIIDPVKVFEIGAITRYLATFIAQAIEKEFFDKNLIIDPGDANYVASIIGGGFSALIIEKTNLFQGVVASIALYNTIYPVVDAYMHCKEINTENLLHDFIFDAIFIFYIVWLLKLIINVYFENDNSEEKPESNEVNIEVTDMVVSLAIKLYYVFKRYIKKKSEK